jgi:hypothetical protein
VKSDESGDVVLISSLAGIVWVLQQGVGSRESVHGSRELGLEGVWGPRGEGVIYLLGTLGTNARKAVFFIRTVPCNIYNLMSRQGYSTPINTAVSLSFHFYSSPIYWLRIMAWKLQGSPGNITVSRLSVLTDNTGL